MEIHCLEFHKDLRVLRFLIAIFEFKISIFSIEMTSIEMNFNDSPFCLKFYSDCIILSQYFYIFLRNYNKYYMPIHINE